ncbi:glycerophosphodiester phosphodiesterase [Nesterenkonia sphaerica]|uniref:Glycerophosphodiester phosphodiesterase n=1 Tax=Nesterenkonia sphaerica TaxID=1804988 RepID=A0A5R9AMZ3_9MICC|nr:glycerophosphodiester phosphodiesterase [Nesterenkonia sphaerica]TLP79819.1 glycerophosphodiester phosphodiesterase [Nesterenkonia sphaerica]
MTRAEASGGRQEQYRSVPYLLNTAPGRLYRAPLAFAHRGADPSRENTMGAFRHAVALGFRYLEVDVRTSADGQLVLFHDEMLDRVTNGAGRLSDHTWAQLSQLRVGAAGREGPAESGERLVRFEDALRALPETHFNVDLKDAEAAVHFAEVVTRLGAHRRVLAASFSDSRRRRVQRLLDRDVASSGGSAAVAMLLLLGPLGGVGSISRKLTGIDCVQVPPRHAGIQIVRPKFIKRCHRAGLQVHVWVVNNLQEMHRLLQMGVDGIVTDDAEALAEVMRQRSVWPQTDIRRA